MSTATPPAAPPKGKSVADLAMTPTQARRRGRRWILGLVALLVIGAGAIYAVTGGLPSGKAADVETFVVTPRTFQIKLNEKGELQATRSVDVKCQVEGRSTIIWLIPEGAEVQGGDLLVKLASNEIDDRVRAEQIKVQNTKASAEAAAKELEITLDQNASDIRKAQLALRNAEIEQQKYLEGDFVQTKIEKELALETAKRTLVQQEDILDDSKELSDRGFITKRELDRRELEKYQAEVSVEKAKIDLRIFLEYTHPKDQEQKASDVEEARKELERTKKKAAAEEAKKRASAAATQSEYEVTEERLAKLLDQQKNTEIRAPAPGLVVYNTGENRWDRRQIAEGAEVYERQTIISLPDTSEMMVKLRIHEAKTGKLAIGQIATISVEGIAGKTFSGRVSKIAPLADSQNAWLNPDLKEYETEVTLDTHDQELKPGTTARVEILVKNVTDVLAVPVQSIFNEAGHTYAFVGKRTSSASPREVEIGDSSDEYVEIRSGLSAGDHVLLAADDGLLAMIADRQQVAGENGLVEDADGKRTQRGERRNGEGRRQGGPHGGPGGPGGNAAVSADGDAPSDGATETAEVTETAEKTAPAGEEGPAKPRSASDKSQNEPSGQDAA